MSSLLISLIKGLASQIIVLHHLTLYGPLAKSFVIAAPTLAWFFYEYGLYAVQAFFVIGGYLAVSSLGCRILNFNDFLKSIWIRYVRLIWPYTFALILVIAVSWIARTFTQDTIVPAAPSVLQTLTHLLFAQGITGQPSLNVGVWYLGIDFQLYAFCALLVWACARIQMRNAFTLLLTCGVFASVLWFRTLNVFWSEWCVWFFYAYGFGALVAQRLDVSQKFSNKIPLFSALLACSLLLYEAFLRQHDWRFAVALISGLILLALPELDKLLDKLPSAVKTFILINGRQSFALFLVHFSLSIAVNAVMDYWNFSGSRVGIAGVLTCWIGANLIASIFYQFLPGIPRVLTRA